MSLSGLGLQRTSPGLVAKEPKRLCSLGTGNPALVFSLYSKGTGDTAKGNSKQQGPSPSSPGDPGFPEQQFLEPQRHRAYQGPQFRCSCSSLGGKVGSWSRCPRSAMVSPAAGRLPVRGWHVTPRLPESLGDQHSPALPRPAQSTPQQLRRPTVQGLS